MRKNIFWVATIDGDFGEDKPRREIKIGIKEREDCRFDIVCKQGKKDIEVLDSVEDTYDDAIEAVAMYWYADCLWGLEWIEKRRYPKLDNKKLKNRFV